MQPAPHPADAVIRPATARDAAGIARVHVETWVDAYAGLLPDKHLLRLDAQSHALAWTRRLTRAEERAATLVAVADGDIVGFAHFGRGREPGQVDTGGEVYMLYVATDWRERGIGRGLLLAALTALSRLGQTQASVWCLAENRSAIGFYHRLGGQRLAESRLERVGEADFPVIGFRWDLPVADLNPPG